MEKEQTSQEFSLGICNNVCCAHNFHFRFRCLMRATENSWKQGVILRANFLAAQQQQQQLQLAEARRWFAKNSWNLKLNLIFEVKVVKLLKIDKTWIRIIFQDSST